MRVLGAAAIGLGGRWYIRVQLSRDGAGITVPISEIVILAHLFRLRIRWFRVVGLGSTGFRVMAVGDFGPGFKAYLVF